MKFKFLSLALLICSSGPASADYFQPSHTCTKPYKPYQFETDYDVQRFKDEVERYRRCIEDFVQQQNQAVTNHQNAANTAIEEWNWYVKHELN
ncbi:hypothetical protein [Vibrio breoganii]|uniref:hypothetical protein n=1 Tax=Vibrio breoganii TaxID=553239 RepID=UPI00037677B8|nr:hypothetical protein [Vibrio breoganii]OED98140.1 hypothetical protein A1QG_11355 [Vibrio breoganii ZF-29]